jgi:hypothetical protein
LLPNNIIAKAQDSELLDGIDAASFLLVDGTAANSETLDGMDSTDFANAGHSHDASYYPNGAKVDDSDALDGLDSSAFALDGHNHNGAYYAIGSKVADSHLLDGLDSSAFALVNHNHNTQYYALGSKVADSDLLDGVDSTGFQRGVGVTRLPSPGHLVDSTPNATYEQMAVVGNFTKLRATSTIKVNWTGHGRASSAGEAFCDWQVRVDGIPDAFQAGRAVLYTPGGINHAPFSGLATFSGVSTGVHTVSVWIRSNASECIFNYFNFAHLFLVEEI